MSISLDRSVVVGILIILAAVCVGCGSPTPELQPQGDPVAEPTVLEPDLPIPENGRERTSRLLRLEQALDNWYIATERQEYSRKDSLERMLLEFTRESFDPIVSDLKHGSPRYRRVMAAALGFSSEARAVKPLMAALTDPYYEVVEHALLSLYNLTRPDVKPVNLGSGQGVAGRMVNQELVERTAVPGTHVDIEKVASFLQHHRPEVRCNAALALRPLVGADSTPNPVLLALINACQDRDDRTRVHALAALAATRSLESIPHLVKGLSDRLPLVRIRCALGLARVGDPQSAPYLIEVLDREEEPAEVKRFVARALAALLGVSGPDAVNMDPEPWRARAVELGIIPPKN